LSFAEKIYKPKFIIDLATLTGAIIMSLGEEYAGLFSNNDELSKNIFEASRALTFEGKEVSLSLALDMTEIQIDYFNFYDYLNKTAE